jgi:HD-GYP domain-containing protein (c-di-GMP phosphodiesterase class II)
VRPYRPDCRLSIPGSPVRGPLVTEDDPWEIVEGFARDVNRCEKDVRNKLAIEAVRSAIKAEAVFWYPGLGSDPLEVTGLYNLSPNWCSGFVRKLIDSTPGLDGRLLRAVLPLGPPGSPLQPRSAALVRVSRSQANWIVALNFTEQRSFQVTDLRIMALVRRVLVNQRRYHDLTGRMTETLTSLVQCLTTSIDAHLPHTRGHSERVARIAVAIGKRLKLPTSVLNDLYFAGLVHDIGITSVPQSLLMKPDRLTEEEFARVKTYPVIGDSILASIKQLSHLRPAVRHHHERYDGRGYPDGLAGEDIPLMARILGFADAFDAMRSPRPHRPALARSEVDDVLEKDAGKQWDPCIVEQYLHGRRHFQAVCEPGAATPEAPDVHYVLPSCNPDSSAMIQAYGAGLHPQPTTLVHEAEAPWS